MNIESNNLYINSDDSNAVLNFINKMTNILIEVNDSTPIVVLCIGTDRATGDSLGPLVGYKLKNTFKQFIYGTLEQPVHAKNLADTITKIYNNHKNPFIIAIDASLGKTEHIGFVTIGKGPIRPGAGANKTLPSIGDVFVTGIVNNYSYHNQVMLQNTRLHVVMKIADVVSLGIKSSIRNANRKKI